MTCGVHLLHNWLRRAGLRTSWGLVVEIVVGEDHENITKPAFVLPGSSNTVCLLQVRCSRHGQIIIQDGLTEGERILTYCLAGSKYKMRPGGEQGDGCRSLGILLQKCLSISLEDSAADPSALGDRINNGDAGEVLPCSARLDDLGPFLPHPGARLHGVALYVQEESW